MPIYEYRCMSCGAGVEVVHAISADGPATCEVCGGKMKKALSTPAIHFKGSGWAKKDARAAASKGSTATAGAKSPDGGGDSTDKAAPAGKEKSAGTTPADPGAGGDAAKPATSSSSAS